MKYNFSVCSVRVYVNFHAAEAHPVEAYKTNWSIDKITVRKAFDVLQIFYTAIS